jgi:hypothetical protein
VTALHHQTEYARPAQMREIGPRSADRRLGGALAAARSENRASGPVALAEADREAFEERAAIMEFDGGLSRGDAEAEARRLIAAAARKARAA